MYIEPNTQVVNTGSVSFSAGTMLERALKDVSKNADIKAMAQSVLSSSVRTAFSDEEGMQNLKSNLKKLEELIEKMNQVTERLGLRMELSVTRDGNSLVRIYNEINNQQITSIPYHNLLIQVARR